MRRGSAYEGRTFSLLTRHGKEQALAPELDRLGARVEVVDFDTDTLGTFSREVPRKGTALEAARAKATLALELAGGSLGLGSEGSFGPGPFGLVPWDEELIVLTDRLHGIEVVGGAHGPARHAHATVDDLAGLAAFCDGAAFPPHALTLRPDDERGAPVWKGLADRSTLVAAFAEAKRAATTGRVFVEHDLRAHHNPTRMALIARAAEDLVARLASQCPRCGTPGFFRVERIPGLPCIECGSPTELARAEIWACLHQDHRETRASAARFAEARRCERCNP